MLEAQEAQEAKDTWYPQHRNCNCCKGYIHGACGRRPRALSNKVMPGFTADKLECLLFLPCSVCVAHVRGAGCLWVHTRGFGHTGRGRRGRGQMSLLLPGAHTPPHWDTHCHAAIE